MTATEFYNQQKYVDEYVRKTNKYKSDMIRFAEEYHKAVTRVIPKHKIIAAVCKVLRITVDEFLSTAKGRYLVYARIIIAKFLEHSHTSIEIGEMLSRDHTTVLYYFKKYDELIMYNDFKELRNKIFNKMNLPIDI